jgi:hypothetical protein
MRYDHLRRRPRCFLAFSGLEVEEFNRLAALINEDWINQRQERLRTLRPKRKRKEGAGRKYALSTLEDQLLLTLVWSRLYPVYLALEYLFAVDESTVSRTLLAIKPLLATRFTLPERLPKKKVRSLEELKEFLPPDIDLDDILMDATEQVIPRPQSKRKRKPYHSGKKRKFTVKTQIATTRKGYIVHISQTTGGRTNDYKLFKKSRLPQVIPKDTRLFSDAGYQGIRKDYPDIASVIPFKRHRGKKELTRSEKIFNKKQRRVRIRVENALARIKKFQAINQIYRHSVHNYNQTFRFVANIVNFRMLCRAQAA